MIFFFFNDFAANIAADPSSPPLFDVFRLKIVLSFGEAVGSGSQNDLLRLTPLTLPVFVLVFFFF